MRERREVEEKEEREKEILIGDQQKRKICEAEGEPRGEKRGKGGIRCF